MTGIESKPLMPAWPLKPHFHCCINRSRSRSSIQPSATGLQPAGASVAGARQNREKKNRSPASVIPSPFVSPGKGVAVAFGEGVKVSEAVGVRVGVLVAVGGFVGGGEGVIDGVAVDVAVRVGV